MEFWGVEVKTGEPLEVVPGNATLVHISQASLGEGKKDKGNDLVCLYANIGGQKLVLGTLSAEKFPQISFDLVFEKKFELSHNWKNGSVYFCGYKAANSMESEPYDSSSDSGSDSDFEIDIPRDTTADNGKPQQLKQEKPDSSAAKQKVKIAEPNKNAKPKENDDDSDKDGDDSTDDEDESTEDEDMVNNRSASSEDEDDEDEANEDDKNEISKKKETAKMAGPSKRRPTESISKTPVPDKKAKFVTPQKTDGKKSDDKKSGGHVATPYPSKQVGKTPANTEKAKQVQKSGGSFSCKSCNRSFNSENALQSHTKAKHTASK